MSRYIDADKLSQDMYHEAFETDTDMQKWDSGCWIRYKMFENVIAKQPTVDAEPIRHGHWTRPRRPKTYERFCSCCGEKSWYCGIGDYNYCPNCGAKMDEEKK